MADEDKPLEQLSDAEKALNEQFTPPDHDPPESDAPLTAFDRLRSFEDRVLGKDTVRISGHVEKGHGSRYSKMQARHRAHHDALVELVEAEKAHTDAGTAEAAAHARLQAAIDRVSATEPQE